jgi:hypothetical protein
LSYSLLCTDGVTMTALSLSGLWLLPRATVQVHFTQTLE